MITWLMNCDGHCDVSLIGIGRCQCVYCYAKVKLERLVCVLNGRYNKGWLKMFRSITTDEIFPFVYVQIFAQCQYLSNGQWQRIAQCETTKCTQLTLILIKFEEPQFYLRFFSEHDWQISRLCFSTF